MTTPDQTADRTRDAQFPRFRQKAKELCDHWQKRAESAEAEIETLRRERDEARKSNNEARRIILATHKNAVKHTDCHIDHCHICDGGLFQCADCGAIEVQAEERICTASEAALTAAQAEIETLSARIGRRADEFADLLTERDGLLAQIETLRRDLAANIAARNDFARDWQKAHERADAAEAALAAAQEEIERLKNLLGDPEGVIAHADAITAMAEKDLTAAQAENARLREWVRTVHDKFKRDEEQGYRSKDRQYAIELLGKALEETALSADMPAGGGEPVAGARMLPSVEIQPADTLPEERGRLISKAYVHEGSVIALYGTNDKLIGWIDTPAWVEGRVYRDQLLPAPAPDWEKAVEAGRRAIEGGYDIDGVEAILRAAAPHLGVREE